MRCALATPRRSSGSPLNARALVHGNGACVAFSTVSPVQIHERDGARLADSTAPSAANMQSAQQRRCTTKSDRWIAPPPPGSSQNAQAPPHARGEKIRGSHRPSHNQRAILSAKKTHDQVTTLDRPLPLGEGRGEGFVKHTSLSTITGGCSCRAARRRCSGERLSAKLNHVRYVVPRSVRVADDVLVG